MKIESSEIEHGIVYFKQFGAERVKLYTVLYISFSAKGNIQDFANNTDSGESARNELSHLKSALFGCEL